MSEIQRDIGLWQRATFGRNQTVQGVMAHLMKEVRELQDAETRDDIMEEAADVAILLFGLAELRGFDLLDAVRFKLDVNKRRTWGAPDAQGVIRHVEEGRC